MVTTTKALVSDEEIERVHANANFGSMSKRRVVDEGVLKYAMGYSGGATQLSILLEHGLVRRPKPCRYGSVLTVKGQRYLRAMYGLTTIDDILNLMGR